MEKKDIKKIGIVFFLFLLVAVYVDATDANLRTDGTIQRNDFGEEEKEVELLLNVEGILKEYVYSLEVEPVRVTREEADEYFSAAIAEIDRAFFNIGQKLSLESDYSGGFVEAEWSFVPSGIVNSDGTIMWEEIPIEGLLVNATVTLTCGSYEQIYSFPFRLEYADASQEQRLLKAVDEWMVSEMEKEGQETIQLPQELEGMALNWSEKKDRLVIKVVILEIIALLVLCIAQRRIREQEEIARQKSIELDYPDIVSQLTLLLGAGMTTRQAWNKIATRYFDKRQKRQVIEKRAYEAVLRMNRRLSEGENERSAYRFFVDEVKIMCFQRLIRLLLGNLEKGAGGISQLLEEETRQAYEQRILTAKKLGEEASTRMLLPLMMMMIVVMAIIMIPAIISFTA